MKKILNLTIRKKIISYILAGFIQAKALMLRFKPRKKQALSLSLQDKKKKAISYPRTLNMSDMPTW